MMIIIIVPLSERIIFLILASLDCFHWIIQNISSSMMGEFSPPTHMNACTHTFTYYYLIVWSDNHLNGYRVAAKERAINYHPHSSDRLSWHRERRRMKDFQCFYILLITFLLILSSQTLSTTQQERDERCSRERKRKKKLFVFGTITTGESRAWLTTNLSFSFTRYTAGAVLCDWPHWLHIEHICTTVSSFSGQIVCGTIITARKAVSPVLYPVCIASSFISVGVVRGGWWSKGRQLPMEGKVRFFSPFFARRNCPHGKKGWKKRETWIEF